MPLGISSLIFGKQAPIKIQGNERWFGFIPLLRLGSGVGIKNRSKIAFKKYFEYLCVLIRWNMIAISNIKPPATKSYKFCQALTAIQALTQEELLFLKEELGKKTSKESILFQSNKPDNHSFFLFGKWPDFEDAGALREKAWKRNFI